MQGTGSSAAHDVWASQLLARYVTWVGSGEKEGESFYICFSAAQCWRGTVAEQGSAWSASTLHTAACYAKGDTASAHVHADLQFALSRGLHFIVQKV